MLLFQIWICFLLMNLRLILSMKLHLFFVDENCTWFLSTKLRLFLSMKSNGVSQKNDSKFSPVGFEKFKDTPYPHVFPDSG